MLDNLLSKVIAAGLAAGVFLLWWPAHLPSTGVGWLVLRGVAWTLAFEVLALCFVPLERMATRALARRRSAAPAHRVRRRLAAAPAPARASGAVMLAFTGLLLPGLLLLHSGRLPAQPAAHTTKVVRKVVVRKVVHEKTVVVREATPAPAPTPYAATSAPVTTTAAKPAAEAPAKKAATAKQATSPSTDTAAKKTTTAPAATTPAPAAQATLPDPAESAAPAATATAPADATVAGS